MLLGTLAYGLVNGAILTLYALGFNLTFGISGIANFAHGALFVLAGFGAYLLMDQAGLPVILALSGSVLLTALLAALISRLLLTRLRGLPEAEIIATFGCSLVILESLRYFGFIGLTFSLPVFVDGSLEFLGVVLDYQRVFILAFGVILTGGLWVFTRHTRVGRALRALAQNERTALALGIDSDRMATLAMALGGGLCALAAVVILPIGTLNVDAGYDVLLEALAVSIVGGLGSAVGIVVSGILLGLSQTLASMYLGSHWMMIVTLAAILAILVVRPSGLFSRQKELEERT